MGWKKIIVTTLCLALVYACNPPAETNPAPAAKPIGYQVSISGEKIPLYGGDMAAVSVWETYLKAHNEQDVETIAALNSEKDFMAYAPTEMSLKAPRHTSLFYLPGLNKPTQSGQQSI